MDTQELNTIPDATEEIWKDIPGFPGYQVSDMGRVRSFIAGGRTVSLKKVAREFGVSTMSIQGALKRSPETRNGNVKLTKDQILDIRQRFADGPQRLLAEKPHILSPIISAGYPRVSLCKEGKIFEIRVHVLVLLTFVGPCPPGLECCHNDGIPAHGWLDNLRYDTRSNNLLDRRKHGTDRFNLGEKCARAKLTDAKALIIRKMVAQGGHTHREIAEMFGVSKTAIRDIIHHRTYGHLPR